MMPSSSTSKQEPSDVSEVPASDVVANSPNLPGFRLVQSDFVLLPPTSSQLEPPLSSICRQYVRYTVRVGTQWVMLLDAVPPAQWDRLLADELGGAIPLFMDVCGSTSSSHHQPSPSSGMRLADFLLVLWDKLDAMRMTSWPREIVDVARLPTVNSGVEADNSTTSAVAMALALVSSSVGDRQTLFCHLSEVGARAINLWATMDFAPAKGVKRRPRISSVPFSLVANGNEYSSKRLKLVSLADQPLWQIIPGSLTYLRISGFPCSADSVQLASNVVNKLMGLATSAYTTQLALPERCKAVVCALEPCAAQNAIEQATAGLSECFASKEQKQQLSVTLFEPHLFKAVGHSTSSPASFEFVPIPRDTAVNPVFLLMWNIPGEIHPNRLVYKMRRSLPLARSFYCPYKTPDCQRNCGFAVARFDRTEHCASAMEQFSRASETDLREIFYRGRIIFTYACMLESCEIPPFLAFPCHNFLLWLVDANKESREPLDALPDYSSSAFACPCHPDCVPVAPAPKNLDWLALTVRQQAPFCQKPVSRLSDLLISIDDKLTAAAATEADLADREEIPAAIATFEPPLRLEPGEQWRILQPTALSYAGGLQFCLLYGLEKAACQDFLVLEAAISKTFSGARNVYVMDLPVPTFPRETAAVFRFRPPKRAADFLPTLRHLEASISASGCLTLLEWGSEASGRMSGLRPTLVPFCPIPSACAARCHFILVWNLNRRLRHWNVARAFLKRYKEIRSVHAPLSPHFACKQAKSRRRRDRKDLNLGYCVLRFNEPRECAQILASLRMLTAPEMTELCPDSELRFTLCRMEDVCCVPPFLFPCHNLFDWIARDVSYTGSKQFKICLESRENDFTCVCHPQCDSLAPPVDLLGLFSQRVRLALAQYGAAAVRSSLAELISACYTMRRRLQRRGNPRRSEHNNITQNSGGDVATQDEVGKPGENDFVAKDGTGKSKESEVTAKDGAGKSKESEVTAKDGAGKSKESEVTAKDGAGKSKESEVTAKDEAGESKSDGASTSVN